MVKIKNFVPNIKGFIPLPVVILAVLIAILVVVPMAYLSLKIQKSIDRLDLALSLMKYDQELILAKNTPVKVASSSAKPTATPSPTPRRVFDSTNSAIEK